MAGATPDRSSVAIRHLAIRCPTEEEQAERLPLSPVTTNVVATGSPGRKYAHGSPSRRSIFKEGSKKQAALQGGGHNVIPQKPASGARGLLPVHVSASDAVQPESRDFPGRHASMGSVSSNGTASEGFRSTGVPPARTASLCSEVSFSHIAEEARRLALSLDAQAEGYAPWPVNAFGVALAPTSHSLGHLEATSLPAALPAHQAANTAANEQQPADPHEPAHSDPGSRMQLPELHSSRQPPPASSDPGGDVQQEAQLQGTPQHSRWARVYPDNGQHADSMTGSGRKRARRSASAADSSSRGDHITDPRSAQHIAPPSASEERHPEALHHRQFSSNSNGDDEGVITNREGTLVLAHAGQMGGVLSPGSSVSDVSASPPPEHSRQAALVAARAVAQVMGLQARHQEDMQAMNCERVALAVDHEHTLANLDQALRENISLQSIMLTQAQQVGALGAAQEALRRQLEHQEQLQALQSEASQHPLTLTLQQQRSAHPHMLLGSPAEPDQEHRQRAAQVPTLNASPSAQHHSRTAYGSPMPSAASQAGTAQLRGDSATPRRAPPPAQTAPVLYGSPAQTPLGSLHRLAHMLHTPQDMAAARMQASGPAPMSPDAQGKAHLSSAAERGLWALLDSPTDSYGSAIMSSPPMQSSSQPQAYPEVTASGDIAWCEHSSRTIDRQDPSLRASGIPDASQQHAAAALASPSEGSNRLQHAAEQDSEHTSATAEGHSSSPFVESDGSTVGALALAPAEASPQPQHAAGQAWEHSSAKHEAHNPLFDSCEDASGSSPKEAWEHTSAAIEGREPFCHSVAPSESSPEKLVMSPPRASDGHRDLDNAQKIITELRQELQASRNEAAQAKQASAHDKQALEVSRMEGEEMAAELQRTQECLTSLQADLMPAEKAYHVSAMLGHDEDIALAGIHPQNAMLHKTLELLAAARSQIASQAQSGAGQHQISPEPSPEARAAERTIEYLREDLEIRSEQLATAQLQLEIAESQIQARQGLIQALDQNEAQLLAQFDEAHEASEQARREVDRLAGQLKEADQALASSQSAQVQLQAELQRERAASYGLASRAQQAQQEALALDAYPEQEHASLNGSESSPGGFQAQLKQLGAQHACELEQERAISQRQESSLRQQVADLSACVEEQRRELAASSESRADLVEQQQVLADALAQRERDVGELRKDLGILESTLRASIDSRAEAHEWAEQLQRQLHEAETELDRAQASAQALAEDLLASERDAMQLTAASTQAAEVPQALVPVFDEPQAEQLRQSREQLQLTHALDNRQTLRAGLTDSAQEERRLQIAAREWQEYACDAAEHLKDEHEGLQDVTGHHEQLLSENRHSVVEPAAENKSSRELCTQLDISPAHEHSTQPGPEMLRGAPPESTLPPDLLAEAGEERMVQLQLIIKESPAAEAQASCKAGFMGTSAAAAEELERDRTTITEAAEPQECQQCNEFAQQLEDCIREYEGSQAEARQLSQQLAAMQQGRDCLQCASLAQQLEACMQAAEARVLHISQQVFARSEAAQQAQRALELVAEDRDALAASLAEHEAALIRQAASLVELQALVNQRDATVLELQGALSAFQQGPSDRSRQMEPGHKAMADVQRDLQGRARADAGQAEPQQLADRQGGADVADLQSHAGQLRMEVAALTADRDHYKAAYEAGCQLLTQLQGFASQALGEAQALREESAALDDAKSAVSAQLAAAQGAAAAEVSSLMREAAELEARLEQSQHTAEDATEAMQSLAAELQAALLEAARCRAGEQYALRELQAQRGREQWQLPDMMQLCELRVEQVPCADPSSPAREGQAQEFAAPAQPDQPDQDADHLAEAHTVQRQQSAALSSGSFGTPQTKNCAQPAVQSEQDNPVRSLLDAAFRASSPLQEAAALSPVSNNGSPRALDPPAADDPSPTAAPPEGALLSPVTAEQTPAAIQSMPCAQRAASQRCDSMFKALPEDASPGDRLQWLASQVALEANVWEDTGELDVDIMGRSEVGSSAAALNSLTHALSTAAKTDEAAEELVARLRLERRMLRGVTNLAVAVTNDALTGSSQAAVMAKRASGFMSAHQEALSKAGLDQTWASLCMMAQKPPCPDATKVLQRENEVQKLVLDELDAEAAEAHLQQDVVLGQAARDVAGLCQTIYETFPGLEQSVPCFEDSVLGPCSLRPAQMLELQVSRCKSGVERLLLNLLSTIPEHALLGYASPRSTAQESCDWQDSPDGSPGWRETPEGHRLNLCSRELIRSV